MRAAVYSGRQHVAVTATDEPTAGPGHVKTKVGFKGICGTDLHEYHAGPIFIPT